MVVRVDSSYRIGSGHVMRCLTLADYLRAAGADVTFLCRDLDGNICTQIERNGFGVGRLPRPEPAPGPRSSDEYADWLEVAWETDAAECRAALEVLSEGVDWLVVDHYGLDFRWEDKLCHHATALFVIDDLADRPHHCDMLLNHNLNPDGERRYRSLVPAGCTLLCGPPYALLRREYAALAERRERRDGVVRRMMVFLGGMDSGGVTMKVCEAVKILGRPDIEVDVVVGTSNPRKDGVRRFCENHPSLTYHCQIANMAELMAAADLAVGAGGTATWERACLGLPTIMIPVAQNQMAGTDAMAAAGAAWNLGYYESVTVEQIASAIAHALEHPAELRDMSERARALFGEEPTAGAEKVVRKMKERSGAEA